MPIYQYSNSNSPVRTVAAISTLSGAKRAYVFLDENAPAEQYTQTIQKMRSLNLIALPSEYEGKAALEVQGYKSSEQFIDILEKNGLTSGAATCTSLKEDKHKNTDVVAARSLKWAGVNYVIGDLAMLIQGIRDKSMKEVQAAIGYVIGTQAILWFGNDQTPTHLHDMADKLTKAMQDKGLNTKETAANSIVADADNSALAKGIRFLKRYPAEIMGAGFAFAGLRIFQTARAYDGAVMSKLKFKDTMLGIVTMLSGALTMFVKEQPHDPNKPPSTGLKRAWEWVEEQPLRIAGAGLLVSTAIHGVSTAQALNGYYKKWQQTGNAEEKRNFFTKGFRGVFVVTNLIAEVLITMSSKGHGNSKKQADNGMEESTFQMAANLLSAQPVEKRAQAEEFLVDYLSSRGVLAQKKDDVRQKLDAAIEKQRSNPWALNMPNAKPAPAVIAQNPTLTATEHAPVQWANRENIAPRKTENFAASVESSRTAAATEPVLG